MRLAHTDWLHHRLAIIGAAEQLAAFRRAAAGAGIIPWQLDLGRMEEDVFHLLAAPPLSQPRTLSVAGARVLAEEFGKPLAVATNAPSHCGGELGVSIRSAYACPGA